MCILVFCRKTTFASFFYFQRSYFLFLFLSVCKALKKKQILFFLLIMEDHSSNIPSEGHAPSSYRSLPSPSNTSLPYLSVDETVYRSVEAHFPSQTAPLRASFPGFDAVGLDADEEEFLRDSRRLIAGDRFAFKAGGLAGFGSMEKKMAGRTAVLPPKPEVISSSSFCSRQSPVILMNHLKNSLADCRTDFRVKESSFKIKGKYHTCRGGSITFEARVFDASDDGDDGTDAVPLSAVEFRRLSGCCMAWNALYRAICVSLSKSCDEAPCLDPDRPEIVLASQPICPDLSIIEDFAQMSQSDCVANRVEAANALAAVSCTMSAVDLLSMPVAETAPVAVSSSGVNVGDSMVMQTAKALMQGSEEEAAPIAFVLKHLSSDDSVAKSLLDRDGEVLSFLETSLDSDMDVFCRRAATDAVCNMCKVPGNRKRMLNESRIPDVVQRLRNSKCAMTRQCHSRLSSALGAEV